MKSKSFSFSNDEAGRFAKHRLLDFIRYEKLRSISSSKFNISGLKSDEFNFLESMYKKLEEDCLYRFINSYMLGGDMTYGTITIASPPYGGVRHILIT